MSGRTSNVRPSYKARLITTPGVRKADLVSHYLRADAAPNWSQRVKEREGDIVKVASKPAITITITATVLSAIELMSAKRVRGLVVVGSDRRLRGTLMATDIVNYLGGGQLYNIVERRHFRDLYGALTSETVESLMNPTPLYVTTEAKVTDVLRLMVLNGIGLVPVVDKEGVPYGVVTEHDMVRYLHQGVLGIRVSEVMSTTLVVVYSDDTLKRAAQMMSLYGFRRVPVISRSDNSIVGVVSALDFIRFFGEHEALKRAESLDIEDVLSTPVESIMSKGVFTVSEDSDVGEAAELMNKYNTNSLIVTSKEGEAVGILTERDVLLAYAVKR